MALPLSSDTLPAASIRRVTFGRVVWAAAVKELQITRRYLPNLVGRVLDLGVRIVFFLLLARMIQVNAAGSPLGVALTGQDLLIFFQGALVLLVFNTTALNTPVESVSRDLYNGTLEFLFSNPSSRYAYFLGTILASALINLVIFLPAFAILIWYSGAKPVNTLLMLLVCGVTLVTSVALGVLIALLAILWRQVSSITAVLAILFELLAGAYLPVSALPPILQQAALGLPYTWAYDLMRAYSFGPRWTTLHPMWVEWTVLAAYGVVFTAASVVLLRLAERRARRAGLHLI